MSGTSHLSTQRHWSVAADLGGRGVDLVGNARSGSSMEYFVLFCSMYKEPSGECSGK